MGSVRMGQRLLAFPQWGGRSGFWAGVWRLWFGPGSPGWGFGVLAIRSRIDWGRGSLCYTVGGGLLPRSGPGSLEWGWTPLGGPGPVTLTPWGVPLVGWLGGRVSRVGVRRLNHLTEVTKRRGECCPATP